jgi:hypothetical protein
MALRTKAGKHLRENEPGEFVEAMNVYTLAREAFVVCGCHQHAEKCRDGYAEGEARKFAWDEARLL